VRMIPDNDRPSRSRATTTTTSPARGVIQERGQPWPVVAGPGQLVGEDPLAASCCQCVALLVQRLVVGAHPGIADGRHLRSVSKVGLLAAVATPGFGPTCGTAAGPAVLEGHVGTVSHLAPSHYLGGETRLELSGRVYGPAGPEGGGGSWPP
jgi:hypothetical protein